MTRHFLFLLSVLAVLAGSGCEVEANRDYYAKLMLASDCGPLIRALAGTGPKLKAQGRDANQIASILCTGDPRGCNYGIGNIMDGSNNPIARSPTLIEFAVTEFKGSTPATYMNSAARAKAFKEAVLAW